MEWSKSAISKAELEKKQREFMEQAMKMAKKAGQAAEIRSTEPEIKADELPHEDIHIDIPDVPEQVMAEEEDVITHEELIEEIREKLEEISEPESDDSVKAEETACAEDIPCDAEESDFFGESADSADDEATFGVFDAEELTKAIESGEISGEGLKQAQEILAEMTAKTEAMRKLLSEQEDESRERVHNSGDIGLNSYIDRHNNNCRGCSGGKFNTH